MKYFIDCEEVSEEVFNSRLESSVEEEVENNFDDFLDEIYEPYKMGNLTFYPSKILSELDPIAYRCAMADEVSARLSDYQYELRRPSSVDVDCSTYEVRDDDEED